MTNRRSARRLPALALAALIALSTATQGSAARPPARERGAAMRLRVMEFNIEYGGTVVDFESVIRAIRASDADVVGIEEAWGRTAEIAADLGWDYYDRRLQLISRFPLIDPPGADGRYTFVEVTPGRVVAVANVHLPSYPYSPERIQLGASAGEALAWERRYRVPAARPVVAALGQLVAAGIPSFLLGDFNAPSHLDWTAATVGSRPQIRFPVDWPVSELVERRGLRDSYREAHPDPLAEPGITWPSGRPRPAGVWNPGPRAPADRIDFVYAGGPVRTLRSTLVGEGDGPGVTIPIDPWPSDHRAVLSTFRVRAATPPVLVAVGSRLVSAGDPLTVTFHAPGATGERIAIVPAGGDPSTAIADLATGGAVDGSLTFGTEGWTPGEDEAVLVSGVGDVLARIPFWIQAAGARPSIGTARRTYAVGDPITVVWRGAPGNRFDWVAIYRRGADPAVAPYLEWLYTGATIDGSAVIDREVRGAWPLPAGRYSIVLLEDDAYRTVARGAFTVTES